mmetsp:Transcript_41482/g.118953  ORF Transcript_41482/g.118953 Transcript_41482/m.118953 type:complete len:318 (-) Transcript_41482:2048-3001(-)
MSACCLCSTFSFSLCSRTAAGETTSTSSLSRSQSSRDRTSVWASRSRVTGLARSCARFSSRSLKSLKMSMLSARTSHSREVCGSYADITKWWYGWDRSYTETTARMDSSLFEPRSASMRPWRASSRPLPYLARSCAFIGAGMDCAARSDSALPPAPSRCTVRPKCSLGCPVMVRRTTTFLLAPAVTVSMPGSLTRVSLGPCTGVVSPMHHSSLLRIVDGPTAKDMSGTQTALAPSFETLMMCVCGLLASWGETECSSSRLTDVSRTMKAGGYTTSSTTTTAWNASETSSSPASLTMRRRSDSMGSARVAWIVAVVFG